jgi:hypothetical protein
MLVFVQGDLGCLWPNNGIPLVVDLVVGGYLCVCGCCTCVDCVEELF